MSYNGSGTFVINTAGQPVVSGTVISSTAFNALTADLATGLSTAITKDGQTTPTANIPMGNNKITGLAVGTAATDAANLSQVQSTTAKLINSISGTDTITGTMSPNLGAYATGQMFYFIAAGDNTGAVTLNIDSLGAKAVTRDGSVALAASDLKSGEVVVVVYDGTRFQVVSQLNSAGDARFANVSIASALNVGGVATFTGGTANGVTYLNGSKALTSGSALVFDGTNLGIGTSSPNSYANYSTVTLNGSAGGEIDFESGGTLVADMFGNSANFNFGTVTAIPIVMRTNNTERLRIDSSGNMGLGVTPSAWDTAEFRPVEMGTIGNFVAGYVGSSVAYIGSNAYYNGGWKYARSSVEAAHIDIGGGAFRFKTAGTGTAGNAITWTQAMTLDSGGSLGIGTTSPSSIIHAAKASGNETYLQLAQTGVESWQIGMAASSSAFAFLNSGTERARINSAGSLLVNSTTDNGQIYVVARANKDSLRSIAQSAGNVGVYGEHSANSGTGYAAYFYNTGSNTGLYISNTAAWQSASDERLKTDIKDIDFTDRLMQLRPRDYLWKSQETSDTPNKRNYGFIAQEVQEVFPDLVGVSPDGMFSVEYTGLIAPLVKAVQELKTELDAAKVKIAALETK